MNRSLGIRADARVEIVMRRAEEAVEALKAAVEWSVSRPMTYMPFTDAGRRVAVRLEQLRERYFAFW